MHQINPNQESRHGFEHVWVCAADWFLVSEAVAIRGNPWHPVEHQHSCQVICLAQAVLSKNQTFEQLISPVFPVCMTPFEPSPKALGQSCLQRTHRAYLMETAIEEIQTNFIPHKSLPFDGKNV